MNGTDQISHKGTETLPAGVAPEQHPAVRVLAVDDEPAAARLLSLILPPPAFRCATAACGEEALVALQREPFDAIISDLQMPGLSGLDLLAEVRRNHLHLAFLVTTGVDDVDVGVKAMRCGADDYLVKPLRESAVLASLENALHKRRLEQELERYRQHLEEMVAQRTEQLQAALRQLEQSYEDTLKALGAAIDLRDSETAGHSERVCRYSLQIARALGWPEKQLATLARGAYLHDIGKLAIPDGILLKPGPLTAEERRVMQRHVQLGFDLLKDIPFLADAAEIVLMHHERFDGVGYPHGLKGERILPGARIFAIADTLDAITSDRPYRKASSFESARETIRSLAGTQLDPRLVDIYLDIAEDTWPTIARNQRQTEGLSPQLRGEAALRLLGFNSSR
jgi:putative nucleotidyltransferase with HDIG domain